MDDDRLGTVIRIVRQRRGWRQGDLAAKAGSSRSAISRIERGDIGPQSIDVVRAVAAALDIQVRVVPRWRGGDLDRLVIELKTDLADMNELIGTFDRKRRLAARIAADRGWDPVSVSAWLIVSEGRTNRRRVEAHLAMLSGSLPDGRAAVMKWLHDPVGLVAGMSFWGGGVGRAKATRPVRRVRASGSTGG